MIADLKTQLETLFSPETLGTVAKFIGWRGDMLQFSAVETEYCAQIRCHIFADFGAAGRTEIAQFSFEELPWNGDVLVSGNVEVNKHYRGLGIGRFLNAQRIEAAKAAGASAIICTVQEANTNERKILLSNGWHQMRSFKSGYEGQTVIEFWLKELK